MTEKRIPRSGEVKEDAAELEREIEYLIEKIGLSREMAERILEDEDLWLLLPEQRHAFSPPEEDVRQWETAYDFAESLSNGFSDSAAINDATRQLIWEMQDRAQEELRRARERAARSTGARGGPGV